MYLKRFIITLIAVPTISSAFQIHQPHTLSSRKASFRPETCIASSSCQNEKEQTNQQKLLSVGSSFLLSLAIMTTSAPAIAVSGGGLDYAGLDLSNQDFSNGNYKGKDFSQVRAFKSVIYH